MKALHQSIERQAVWLLAVEDRLDDVRRQAGQAESPGDVAVVHVEPGGQGAAGVDLTRVEQGLPRVGSGQGSHQDFPCQWFVACESDDLLAAGAFPEIDGDADGLVLCSQLTAWWPKDLLHALSPQQSHW